MPYFDGSAGRVYYRAWRAPAPRTAAVVFLHGFGEHSGVYHRLGDALTGAGIDLWALDEIGHGPSDGERAVIESIDDRVENGWRLTALADAAEAGGPLFLAGHSLGAAAAAVSASRDPSDLLGEDAVHDYTLLVERDWHAYITAVTDWERDRFLDLA